MAKYESIRIFLSIPFLLMVMFVLFFVIIGYVDLAFINMPPVWDAAPGAFASAIFLLDNNFDLNELVKQNGYISGGPNVHSFSVINLLTYFLIWVFNGDATQYLPVLHIIQFALSAVVLTCTFFIAFRLLGLLVAFVLSFALLFYPLFLVQTGYVYMEVPGAALILSGLLAWAYRHFMGAVMFAAVACMVKSFGIVLMFSFFLLFLLDKTLSKQQRYIWCITIIIIALTIEIIKWGPITSELFDRSQYFSYLGSVFSYLNSAPDLKLLVLSALVIPLAFFLKKRAYTPILMIRVVSEFVSSDAKHRLLIAVYLVPAVFVGFIATVPLSGKSIFPLLRYYVWVLPLMFIGATYALKLLTESIVIHFQQRGDRAVNTFLVTMLIILTTFFVMNREGRFYPSLGASINSFSAVERSFEYLDFFKIQKDSVISLEALQNGRPVFVTRGEYYFLSSPLMGYVSKEMKNIFLVLKHPYNSANLTDYPDEFLLLDVPTNSYHGGGVIKQVLRNALSNKMYAVTVLVKHHQGRYASTIFRISKRNMLEILS